MACKTYLCHDDGECGEAAKTGCGTVKEDCDVYGPSAITSARSLDRDKGEQQTSRTSPPPPSLLPTHSSGLYRSLLPLELCEPVFTNSLCRTRRQRHSEQRPRHSNDLYHNTPPLRLPPRAHALTKSYRHLHSSHDHSYYEPSSLDPRLVVRKACHPRQASMPSCASSYTTISTTALLKTPYSLLAACKHSNPAIQMQRTCLLSAIFASVDTRPPLTMRAPRECTRSIWDALTYSPTLVSP